MAAPKKYCVLVNGDPPDYLSSRFGSYGQMYVDMLKDEGQDEQWDLHKTFQGCFPSAETLDGYDGIVLTGSVHDAYGSEEWLVKLRAIVVRAHDRKQRILGICFGAQLIATALGGRVAPSNHGMQAGVVKCTLLEDDPLLQHLLLQRQPCRHYLISEIHQDEIQGLPAGARLLATSKLCPVEAFAIDDHILAFQGHPEFNNELVRCFISVSKQRGDHSPDKCEAWAASVDEFHVDTPQWHTVCRRFLKGTPPEAATDSKP